MKCPKCGHSSIFDFDVCKKCGHDVNEEYKKKQIIEESIHRKNVVSNEPKKIELHFCPICKKETESTIRSISVVEIKWILWFLIGGTLASLFQHLFGSFTIGLIVLIILFVIVKSGPTHHIKLTCNQCNHISKNWIF
jgi:hypothetical protein